MRTNNEQSNSQSKNIIGDVVDVTINTSTNIGIIDKQPTKEEKQEIKKGHKALKNNSNQISFPFIR